GSTFDWQISSLHGDIVATTADGSTIDSTAESDDFGSMSDTSDVGTKRYAWLGAKQRAADNPDGIGLMGIRLYNPAAGRFLSKDPVAGGSCNRYDYVCGSPINSFDLDGKWARKDIPRGGWSQSYINSQCKRYQKLGRRGWLDRQGWATETRWCSDANFGWRH